MHSRLGSIESKASEISQSINLADLSKKLVNSPSQCVDDMLNGLSKTYPGIVVNRKAKVILLPQDDSPDTVAIISGGGTGHEPFPSGFVGKGMLTAAACGDIFSSPTVTTCLTTIYNSSLVKKGVLVLVMNYSGHTLNYALASETALDMGIDVKTVIIGEDCAFYKVGVNDFTPRRTLVGILFAIKIASALALQGQSLTNLKNTCTEIVKNMATMGICTRSCTLPGQRQSLFPIAPDEFHLGYGVHGEAGKKCIKMLPTCEIVSLLLEQIIKSLKLQQGDCVCAMVNSLGATTPLEYYTVAAELENQLELRQITLKRMYAGRLMTALDGGGLQICLLKISENNKYWIDCLDAPTEAPAWPGCSYSHGMINITFKEIVKDTIELTGPEYSGKALKIFRACLEKAAEKVIENEPKLNKLDTGCGDGNTGTNMKRLADDILAELDTLPFHSPKGCLLTVARMAADRMGGTSGGLYSIMLRTAAREAPEWPKSLHAALETIKQYSPARRGDRTFLDVLIPASEEINKHKTGEKWNKTLERTLEKAMRGCEETQFMKALVGRASYVTDAYLHDIDAGAFGALCWLHGVVQEVMKHNL